MQHGVAVFHRGASRWHGLHDLHGASVKPIDRRAKAKRAALKALDRAKRAAERAGVELSDWEGEFLGSVEGRVKTYGRAFADPEKGPAEASLSMLQTVKLKEITAKARGKNGGDARTKRPKSGFKRRKGFVKKAGKTHGKQI